MTKGFKRYLPIWCIIVLLFNVFVWVVPFDRNELFYTLYYSAIGAFVIQLLIVFFAYRNKNKTISQTILIYSIVGLLMLFVIDFYIIYNSIKYFVLIKPWVIIVINIIILGLHYVFLILLEIALGKNEERDKIVKDKTEFISSLINQVNAMYRKTNNKNMYRLYEALKYSNKISNKNTKEIDEQIEQIINKLKEETNQDAINNYIDKALKLLIERESI